MMVSRFTRAVQLIALALVFCVANVYVMGGPLRTNTDPRPTDKSNVTQPAAEKDAATTTSEAQPAGPQAASERMPLTAGTKTVLSRVFSKDSLKSRAAASSSFVNVKSSAGSMFNAPRKALAKADDNDDDNDDNGRRNMWIVVGVLAAVITIAVIGLRADRNRDNIGAQ
jgi:hypothetical protein